MIKKVQNIIYGISEKKDGDMKLVMGEHNAEPSENRRDYFKKQGLEAIDEVAAEIVHGGQAKGVIRKDAGKIIEGIDGLVTAERNLILAVTMADCLPIYFYNYKANIIALAHAGWRGLRHGIVENTLAELKRIEPDCLTDTQVFIGPHIQACHFEVLSDVYEHFEHIPGAVKRIKDKTHLNLAVITKNLLFNQGIKKENISISKDCTYCDEKKYFSFRRDKPNKVLAQMAYIVIKE